MSINGVIQNVKWSQLVLTLVDSGVEVEGKKFVQTNNQRWIGSYKWDDATQQMLVAIKNKETNYFLAWTAELKVVMNSSEYWWKLVYVRDQVGFQVPEIKAAAASANDESFYTLELEADKSVTLKYQQGRLFNSQLWTIVPK
ncbi:hypothetical protein BDR05DRAFT_1060298 [Suillus weaverae]|nr:hypothetical protein BDR05DRAFT_1060298 [Suillus weaverae]